MMSAVQGRSALAFRATVHCLTGCGAGEVIGQAIATAGSLGNVAQFVLGDGLGFVLGYALTMRPLLREMFVGQALRIALAVDTASIVAMEIGDNVTQLLIPGAMGRTPLEPIFWLNLAIGLAIGFAVAYPVNLWSVGRGGHAAHHGTH